MTYISLLLFKASKTFWYRRDLGVLASCKHTFPKDVSKPILVAEGDFTIVAPTTSPTRGLASAMIVNSSLSLYLSELQQLPVIIDIRHQVYLRVKVLLLVDHAQVVKAQVSYIHPETFE